MTAIWDEESAFYSASSRLARGYEHISQMEGQIRGYFAEKPYELVRDLDPADRTYQRLKFKFTKRLPESCALLAAEALEALRFSLDQAGYAAAVLSGKIDPKRTQFPISDTPDELDNLIVGRKACRDIPEAIVTLFRSFNPYKGAGNPLWALNKLRNSAHKKLIPVQLGGSTISVYNRSTDGWITPVNPAFDSAENEIVFGRAPVTDKLDYNVRPTFNVCFDQTEVTGREYVFGFLMRAGRHVEDILLSTEEACRRIGLPVG
jgi:hypothetical protein